MRGMMRVLPLLFVAAAVAVACTGGDDGETERTQLEAMLIRGEGEGVCDDSDGVVACRSFQPTSAECRGGTKRGNDTYYRCRIVYPADGPPPKVVCAALRARQHPVRAADGTVTTVTSSAYNTRRAKECSP